MHVHSHQSCFLLPIRLPVTLQNMQWKRPTKTT
jgi:hypothetical protein